MKWLKRFIQEYRNFLNNLQLWYIRADFDVAFASLAVKSPVLASLSNRASGGVLCSGAKPIAASPSTEGEMMNKNPTSAVDGGIIQDINHDEIEKYLKMDDVSKMY